MPEPARVLLVDDEVGIQNSYRRALKNAGFEVSVASDGVEATRYLETDEFDVIVSDIMMPSLSGIELLQAIRVRNEDVPVVLMTANPALETATQAVHYGAVDYLIKPIDLKDLIRSVQRASQLYKLARVKREALAYFNSKSGALGELRALESSFESALESFWMVYQPIIRWSRRSVYSYEALLRSSLPAFPHPGALIEAAERLGKIHTLSRALRDKIASDAEEDHLIFVNLHSQDLNDDNLFHPETPLSKIAKRVVLEITERASIEEIKDLRPRLQRLRELGFRIAIDDLGAGYAGLTSFATLRPEIVKIDMSLIRDVDKDVTKQRLVQSLISLCKELSIEVVCEGIETTPELATLASMGCDLFQGYLFAKPVRHFQPPTFPEGL